MLNKPLFINKFQKGSSENANIGMGSLVGIDTYTKKGVAQLSKASSYQNLASSDGYPHFLAISSSGSYLWAQMSNGKVYYSTAASSFGTWQETSTAFPVGAGVANGSGLVFFQGFMFAFTETKIWYWKDTVGSEGQNPSAGAWVDWTSAINGGGGSATLVSLSGSPIDSLHFPLVYPSARGVYFGNGIFSGALGFFGQNGTTTFNPAGTLGTDFLFNGAIFRLPSLTYTMGSLSFLPPSNVAIAAYPFQNPQNADLITWDTFSANKFNPPLTLYSNSQQIRGGSIKQLYNRNQVLYAITGGNHTIYETNGSTFNLVDDIALYSTVRGTSGAETNLPVFFDSYPQAICVLGNKLITGVATPPTNDYLTTGYGIYPFGAWSIAFNPDGTTSTQCEFVLPAGALVSPSGTGNYAKITCILPIGGGKLAIGFGVKTSGTLVSGIAITSSTDFIGDGTKVAIESPMFEIGTDLNPQAVNNIELLFVNNLESGTFLDVAYRTRLDQNYTVLSGGTFTVDGTTNSFKITKNEIGTTRYLQLRVRMCCSSTPTISPLLRNIIIS